jgi:membrane fusion protein, multidrug efflux system
VYLLSANLVSRSGRAITAITTGAPAVVVALGLIAACGDGKKPPPAPPPPAAVQVAPVVRRDLPLYIEAVGAFDGYVNVDIRARVRGYLESQTYKDGSSVALGAPLFTIDDSEYQAAARAAQAALSRAKVGLAKNRLDVERGQGLVKAGVGSQQDLDNALAGAADAEAQIRSAEAQLQTAQLNLGYTRIRSPIAGVAGLALVRVGNLVGQDGPTLLTTVSQVDPIRVNFPLSELDYVRYPDRFKKLDSRDLAWAQKQFPRLDAGGNTDDDDPGIQVVLADGKIYNHRGVIIAVNRQIDATTGTVQIQSLVPNPDGILRPGEYANVRIRRQDEGKNVVVVPEKAILSVQGTSSVAVVGADNKVSLRRVELGPSGAGVRVVLKGLEGGENIVVEGVQRVSDGATVDPRPAAASPTPGAASPTPGAAAAAPGAAPATAPRAPAPTPPAPARGN